MRSLSALRLAKRCNLDLLSSSAQTFFSPARCETARCTLRRADQHANNLRKVHSGSAVVKSLLMPASAAVLSDAVGSAKLKCLECNLRCASIASASCASVSKHAMYGCADLLSWGQRCRISVIDHDSENQRNSVEVLTQPPMPTASPSAMASAAAMQCNTWTLGVQKISSRAQKNCSCTWAQDTFFDMASWASQDTQFAHLGTVILEGYIRLGKASLWPYVLTPPLGKLILKATYDLAWASPLPYIPIYDIQSFAKFLKWHPRKFWHMHASQNDIQTFSKFLKRHPRKIWHTQAALSLSQIYIYINIYIYRARV